MIYNRSKKKDPKVLLFKEISAMAALHHLNEPSRDIAMLLPVFFTPSELTKFCNKPYFEQKIIPKLEILGFFTHKKELKDRLIEYSRACQPN